MKHVATLACDRVIIDQRGAHSLITVMSNADIAVAQAPKELAGQPIPLNAVMPKEWFVFSMWMPAAEDAGKSFEQVIEIYWPNSDKFTEGRLPFKAEDKASYNSIQLLGFPIGQLGNIKILTWLEQQGNRISETFDYYVNIKHLEHPPIASAPAPKAN